MNNINSNEKIAFCITCMNRLNHLQQTLEKNIQDNYLSGKVEFILLDYNSNDGLGEWIKDNMKKYIDEGILVYYRTPEPVHYLRSHSRNMAFRLANATVLCNLDADNFLGEGFASFMLQEFSKNNNIFYTNNYSVRDTFGRFCVRRNDFESIRGYNESLQGYGYEDADIFNRLWNNGLRQMFYENPEFYHFVKHTYIDRVSEEPMYKNLNEMYITYINPYTSGFLLLNKDYPFSISFSPGAINEIFVKDKKQKKGNYEKRGLCSANVTQAFILPTGDITICEELMFNPKFILGNIISDNLETIWKNNKLKSLSNISLYSNSPCGKCKEFLNCRSAESKKGVCWKEILHAYGEKKWNYPDPKCPYAPIKMNPFYIE